ncbi:MAG TPA: hypothetical protein VNO32_55835 [Candidatus Acidoferrum sp.]|nr:hypothetical protein [Candidatus Acidoferrum sp.]
MRFLRPDAPLSQRSLRDLRLQKTHPNKEEFLSALPVVVEEGQQSDARWPATHGVRVGRPAMARLTSNQSENTKPILDHYVRDFLIAQWGDQIAENIEPLEIQKWFNALHNKKGYGWTTVSKIRGIMNRIFKIGIIHKKVTKNPVEGLATSTKTTYKAIKITPAQTLLILRCVMGNMLHFTLVFLVAATALRSSEVLSLAGLTSSGKSGRSESSSRGRNREWTGPRRHPLPLAPDPFPAFLV